MAMQLESGAACRVGSCGASLVPAVVAPTEAVANDRDDAAQLFLDLAGAFEVLASVESEGHEAARKQDWSDENATAELLEPLLGMFADKETANDAVEALLQQMQSIGFAGAMLRFCAVKLDQASRTPPADVPA